MNEKEISLAKERMARVGITIRPQDAALLNRHYLESEKKLIIIMSHTSYTDLLLGALLFTKTSLPVTALVGCHDRFNFLWKRIGLLTVNRGDSGSSVTSIVSELKKRQKFALLMGLAKTEPNPSRIRSGYFYIAKETGSRIIVVGFDYWKKTSYISELYWTIPENLDYSTFQSLAIRGEKSIVEELQKIYPHKPNYQIGFQESLYFEQQHQDDQKQQQQQISTKTTQTLKTQKLLVELTKHAIKNTTTTNIVAVLLLILLSFIALLFAASKFSVWKKQQQTKIKENTTRQPVFEKKHKRFIVPTLSFLLVGLLLVSFIVLILILPLHILKAPSDCLTRNLHPPYFLVCQGRDNDGSCNPSVLPNKTKTREKHYLLWSRLTNHSWHKKGLPYVLSGFVSQSSVIETQLVSSSNNQKSETLLLQQTGFRNLNVKERESQITPEDMRMFYWQDQLYGIGNIYKKDHEGHEINTPTITLFDDKEDKREAKFTFTIEPCPKQHSASRRHKNWVHVPDSKRLLICTDIHPHLNVYELIIPNREAYNSGQKTATLKEFIQSELKLLPALQFISSNTKIQHLRGTTNWLPWKLNDDDTNPARGFLFVAHESQSRNKSKVGVYRSLFIIVDANYELYQYSKPLCLCGGGGGESINHHNHHEPIQFCTTLIYPTDDNNSSVWLGLGINNKSWKIIEMTRKAIQNCLLFHSK